MVETERSLKACFLEHQRKSSVGSEVSQYLHVGRPEQGVSWNKMKILTVENKKFERGVKVIYIGVASQKKDGGCYLLPSVWTNLLVPGPLLMLKSPTWHHNTFVDSSQLDLRKTTVMI